MPALSICNGDCGDCLCSERYYTMKEPKSKTLFSKVSHCYYPGQNMQSIRTKISQPPGLTPLDMVIIWFFATHEVARVCEELFITLVSSKFHKPITKSNTGVDQACESASITFSREHAFALMADRRPCLSKGRWTRAGTSSKSHRAKVAAIWCHSIVRLAAKQREPETT